MVQMHMMIVNYGCGTCRSKPCANSFAPMFFFRVTPSAFVLIEGYFLRAYFSATIQTFQKETQLDALSNRVKIFRKFSTGAILLASKARNFRKFLGFLSILLFFFSQTTANWPDVGTNRRKTMFSLIW